MTDPATMFDNLQHVHNLTPVGQPPVSNCDKEPMDLPADWLQSCSDIPSQWLSQEIANGQHTTTTTITTTTSSSPPPVLPDSNTMQQGSAQLLQQAKAALEMDPVIEQQKHIRYQLQQLQQQQQVLKEHLRVQANEYLKKLQSQNQLPASSLYPLQSSQDTLQPATTATSTAVLSPLGLEYASWLAQQNKPQTPQMDKFPVDEATDFKHVLYNLLVDSYNNPNTETFVQQYSKQSGGKVRNGFRFNARMQPEKKLPEFYSLAVRKANLDKQDEASVFTQDLYKFYLRACVELLSKYFEKEDKYTYLYDEIPLFVAGGALNEAAQRIKTMKTRSRKRRKS